MKAPESLKMCSFLVAGLVSHGISFPCVTGWEECSPRSFKYLDSYLIEVSPSWNRYIVQPQQRELKLASLLVPHSRSTHLFSWWSNAGVFVNLIGLFWHSNHLLSEFDAASLAGGPCSFAVYARSLCTSSHLLWAKRTNDSGNAVVLPSKKYILDHLQFSVRFSVYNLTSLHPGDSLQWAEWYVPIIRTSESYFTQGTLYMWLSLKMLKWEHYSDRANLKQNPSQLWSESYYEDSTSSCLLKGGKRHNLRVWVDFEARKSKQANTQKQNKKQTFLQSPPGRIKALKSHGFEPS